MDTHTIINLLVGVLLPMLVAALTHTRASSGVKSAALLIISVLTSVLSTLTDVSWRSFVSNFTQQFAAAVAAHFGFLSPVGLTGSTGAIQRVVPGGLGGPSGTTAGGIEGDAAP